MLKYAIDIFGLDKGIIDDVSSTEQSKFVRSLICLLITTVLTFISTFWGGRLLTGSWFVGFLIGVIFTYVIFSILRFALITIKLPVAGDYYEYVKKRQHGIDIVKPKKKDLEEERIASVTAIDQKTQQNKDINSVDIKKQVKKTSLLKRFIRILKEKLKGVSLNIGVIVRIFTFCVIMQVPIFFTVVLLKKNTSEKIIATKREKVFEYYKEVLNKSKNSELEGLYKSREELQKNLLNLRRTDQTKSITYNNKIEELNQVENNINKIEAYWDKEIPLKLNKFRLSIQDDFYVAPLISVFFGKIDYWIIEFIYLVLFFLPVRIFRNLRKKSELYQYNLKIVSKYRKQIINNHVALEEFKKQKLSEFGVKPVSKVTVFKDSPFNTVKNKGTIREQEVDISEFYAN